MQSLFSIIQNTKAFTLFRKQRHSSLLHRLSLFCFSCILVLSTLSTTPVHAQENGDWWFDIEIVLFKRNLDGSQLNEEFSYAIQPIDTQNAVDLISERLYPDTRQLIHLLPQCYQQPNQNITLPKQTAPGFEINSSLYQALPADPIVTYDQFNPTATSYEQEAGSHTQTLTQAHTGFEDQPQEQSYNQGRYSNRDQQLSETAPITSAQAATSDDANKANEAPPLESFQMAFSMPEDDSQNGEIGIDEEPQQVDATATTGLISNAEAKTNLATDIDGPPAPESETNAILATYEQSGDVYTSETELVADLATEDPSTIQTEPNVAVTELDEFAHIKVQAIHSPMKILSKKQIFNLMEWEVPTSIACAFSTEQSDLVDNYIDAQFIQSIKPQEAGVHYIESIPNNLYGLQRYDIKGPYLLSKTELKLRKLAKDLGRKRGINNLLHLGWRQHIKFGRSKAKSFRLFAGKNYSKEFDYQGFPLAPETLNNVQESELGNIQNNLPQYAIQLANQSTKPDDLVAQIRDALNEIDKTQLSGIRAEINQAEELPLLTLPEIPSKNTPEQVWELDGLFKIYLQNIGRVPYLHIDSQLNYRQPMILENYRLPDALLPANIEANNVITDVESTTGGTTTNHPAYFLKPYPFKQLRRVISRQIHYFDHPMFGMVVQVRRYRMPGFSG